ncbi:hypothetical protein N7492_008887 [Penicillium capsulatum]|uniref:Uncharacterized protein n=1 Tax=Penicillium capsulatum TaxID=69766 RepID=A0A9W9HTK8_9EURO|nr:hypothetical protein N7492_008887 [Penicillium capsulatum]KAJ6106289.1 hypothetical protein N7512_009806 [Penicillium capsulatum]
MLWLVPAAVFGLAHLWTYSGRGIPYLNVGPDSSLSDRALAATKLATAVYGAEIIGTNVVNVAMSSNGQQTISAPEENPIPTIETPVTSDFASDHQPTFSDRVFSVGNMAYGWYLFFFTARPGVAWFTVYPQWPLVLIVLIIGSLSCQFNLFKRNLTRAYEYIEHSLYGLNTKVDVLGNERNDQNSDETWIHIDYLRNDILELRQWQSAQLEDVKIILQRQNHDNAANILAHTYEIQKQLDQLQEWQSRKHEDFETTFQSIEKSAHAIEGLSKMLNVDWESSLNLQAVKTQLRDINGLLDHYANQLRAHVKNDKDNAANFVRDLDKIMKYNEIVSQRCDILLLKAEQWTSKIDLNAVPLRTAKELREEEYAKEEMARRKLYLTSEKIAQKGKEPAENLPQENQDLSPASVPRESVPQATIPQENFPQESELGDKQEPEFNWDRVEKNDLAHIEDEKNMLKEIQTRKLDLEDQALNEQESKENEQGAIEPTESQSPDIKPAELSAEPIENQPAQTGLAKVKQAEIDATENPSIESESLEIARAETDSTGSQCTAFIPDAVEADLTKVESVEKQSTDISAEVSVEPTQSQSTEIDSTDIDPEAQSQPAEVEATEAKPGENESPTLDAVEKDSLKGEPTQDEPLGNESEEHASSAESAEIETTENNTVEDGPTEDESTEVEPKKESKSKKRKGLQSERNPRSERPVID